MMKKRYTRQPQSAVPAQATRWYDPQAPLSRTFCNPMNISYNFEPFNNNVRPNGSFLFLCRPDGGGIQGRILSVLHQPGRFSLFQEPGGLGFRSCRLPTQAYGRRPVRTGSLCKRRHAVLYRLHLRRPAVCGTAHIPKRDVSNVPSKRMYFPHGTPVMFLDDDGRLYMYYGSSNEYPLKSGGTGPE